MLAVKFIGNGKAVVEDVPMPKPKVGEVLLKVHTSALCGSENKRYLSKEGSTKIPGHEMTGEVVETNNVTTLKVGDRVAVQIMDGCGQCYYCRSGFPQFCKRLDYKGECHAEYVAMPEKCCIKLPDDISYDLGVLLGGDTVGVAFRAVSQLPLHPKKTVLVSGGGPIGLGMTAFLKYCGCFVILTEPSEYRREYAQKNAGADIVLDPLKEGTFDKINELTAELGPEIIVECSGNPKAQLQALELVQCRGTVAFAGENYGELPICPSMHIIHKEVKLLGAFYFTAADFHEIVGLYRKGLKVEQLVSHKVPLKDSPEIFDLFVKGRTGKVLLHP